jgi:hypothetical protein
MTSIALIGLALGLIRGADRFELMLGEMTPVLMIGLLGSALALITQGTIRKFFVGFAISGVILGLAIWLGPLSFRNVLLDRIILLIDDRFGPREPGTAATYLQYSLLFSYYSPSSLEYQLTRSPFVSGESQIALGLLELTIVILVGMIVLIPSRFTRNFPKILDCS